MKLCDLLFLPVLRNRLGFDLTTDRASRLVLEIWYFMLPYEVLREVITPVAHVLTFRKAAAPLIKMPVAFIFMSDPVGLPFETLLLSSTRAERARKRLQVFVYMFGPVRRLAHLPSFLIAERAFEGRRKLIYRRFRYTLLECRIGNSWLVDPSMTFHTENLVLFTLVVTPGRQVGRSTTECWTMFARGALLLVNVLDVSDLVTLELLEATNLFMRHSVCEKGFHVRIHA